MTLQNEQLSVATSLELGLNVISPVLGVVEGSTEARSWHVLLVGLELDHRSVAWLRSIGR